MVATVTDIMVYMIVYFQAVIYGIHRQERWHLQQPMSDEITDGKYNAFMYVMSCNL